MAISEAVLDAAKQSRRREFRELTRAYLTENNPAPKIIEHLSSVLPAGAIVSAYRAKAGEVSIDGLFSLTGSDYRFVFPRIEGDSLDFYEPFDSSCFEEGPFGVMEPHPKRSTLIPIDRIDVALVPGLAFDREGNRLGKGRGYFDRALANFRGLKIGIGTRVQLSDEPLPSSEYDIPMDMIVTDDFVLRFFKS